MSSLEIDHFVQSYGDLVFDLCQSILWSSTNAQVAFRNILKSLRRNYRANRFEQHEREWVLRVTCDRLRSFAKRHTRKMTASEKIEADTGTNISSRFKQFDQFFRRLAVEDQILLTLRDKYGLPYSEIASAMNSPEETLKVRRQQALRTLEEWLWNS